MLRAPVPSWRSFTLSSKRTTCTRMPMQQQSACFWWPHLRHADDSMHDDSCMRQLRRHASCATLNTSLTQTKLQCPENIVKARFHGLDGCSRSTAFRERRKCTCDSNARKSLLVHCRTLVSAAQWKPTSYMQSAVFWFSHLYACIWYPKHGRIYVGFCIDCLQRWCMHKYTMHAYKSWLNYIIMHAVRSSTHLQKRQTTVHPKE